MKVLVVSHMYPSTFNEAAGIFVHDQVKELIRQGCEVKVISPVPWAPFPLSRLSCKWKAYSQVPRRSVWEGVEVYYPRYIAFPRDAFFTTSGRRMYRSLKSLVAGLHRQFDFDLIHAHVALPDGAAAVLIGENYKRPVVVTIHGQDLYRTIHKGSACKRAISGVFEKAGRVVTVSGVLERIAKSNIGLPEKLITVHNGVALDKVLYERQAAGKTILSVSYLIVRKGIDFNLKAISELVGKHPDLKYKIIGDGPEAGDLRKLASDLGLDEHVEFLGHLSNNDVMKHMSVAGVFSLPSWDEAFGVVYIEALAHGVPVIGCRGEGIEDIVKHGETGLLVEPKDVNSLAEAIDYLLNNPDKARAMGERGRELVLANFTWERNAKKIIELYEEVVSNHKRL